MLEPSLGMIKALLMSLSVAAALAGQTNADPFAGKDASDTRIYELRTYQAKDGKLDALLNRFRDHTVALFEKHGMTNIGYWVPVENPDNLLIYLMAYPDKESRDASWEAFLNDSDWKKAAADSEVDGKLVGKVDSIFMKQTDFSVGFGDLFSGGLYEMRTYTATPGHLPSLHARFRDHTLGLFAKHGMNSHGYFQLTPGQPGAENTLLYFLSHKDAESATKSWDAFRADPEWIVAKMASEKEAGESLTVDDGVKSVFLNPTDFSPVK
jgi:hypothetical protein